MYFLKRPEQLESYLNALKRAGPHSGAQLRDAYFDSRADSQILDFHSTLREPHPFSFCVY